MLAGDAGLSELMAKGLRDYSVLSETERARFVSTSMAILLCTQDAFIKWRNGTLATDLWSGWEQFYPRRSRHSVSEKHASPIGSSV